MSQTDRKDVLIIGGGCAALWLAHYLAERKIACVTIDQHPFAGYASTRNQGWLQTGAFYASLIKFDRPTAEACRLGYSAIEKFVQDHHISDVLQKHVPCYFLYDDDAHQQAALRRCATLGIPVRPLAVSDIERAEPILRGTSLKSAISADDRPIDASRLLQVVASQAGLDGASFRVVTSLDSITPRWNGSTWLVRLDNEVTIECEVVVAACGVYIPSLLNRLIPGQVPRFKRTKIPVFVIHGNVADAMLITPCVPKGPNLVPFSGNNGSGVTVCLLRNDTDIGNHTDDQLPAQYMEEHAASVAGWFPGIEVMLRQGGDIPAHFYVCQKLLLQDDDASRAHILLFHASQQGAPNNVVTFYPGKFTAAPVAAKECADGIEGLLGGTRAILPIYKPPAIARQQYSASVTHKLTLQHGHLFLEQLP